MLWKIKMSDNRYLSLTSLQYNLPQERIALYPVSPRDASKLLIYKNGNIQETVFKNLSEHIPENSLLVFNNSKVIPARLIFHKESGAKIELFCLEQMEQKNEQSEVWKCFVGGVAKWKNETLVIASEAKQSSKHKEDCFGHSSLEMAGLELRATLLGKDQDAYLVQFEWNKEIPFYDILEIFGDVPLPPYLKRATEDSDKLSYQTVYSEPKGSVAAPTAGLHFTQDVFQQLAKKNVQCEYATLHVGAGTFKPIKTENVYEHEMHHEWIEVSLDTIRALAESETRTVIPVGTTSLRTIETLYWLGIKLLQNGEENFKTELLQFENEMLENNAKTPKESFEALVKWCKKTSRKSLIARTQIMITPDYNVRTAKAILTNFHQPESSLLLLISAFVGNEWKTIYDYALAHDFRFLSYGDSSLLWLAKQ